MSYHGSMEKLIEKFSEKNEPFKETKNLLDDTIKETKEKIIVEKEKIENGIKAE